MHVTILTIDGEEFAHNNIETVIAFSPKEGEDNLHDSNSVGTETVYINTANVAAYVVGPNQSESKIDLSLLELDDTDEEGDED